MLVLSIAYHLMLASKLVETSFKSVVFGARIFIPSRVLDLWNALRLLLRWYIKLFHWKWLGAAPTLRENFLECWLHTNVRLLRVTNIDPSSLLITQIRSSFDFSIWRKILKAYIWVVFVLNYCTETHYRKTCFWTTDYTWRSFPQATNPDVWNWSIYR